MSYKSVNTDAARYRALRREEVMVSMTHDGNTGSTPWLEGDELDKCADSLLAATPLEPIIEQAQPDAIRNKYDWVQGPYVTDTMGSGWCVRIDGTDIFADLNQYGCKGRVTFQIARGLASKEEAEAMLAAWLRKKAISVADQAQLGTVSEALESARWRNALVGLCDTDRIDSPEQAIANVKRRMRPMGLTQQPVSGADGLTDAAIEMLAKQYDCHNAPGFKGFARAVAALAQQEPRTDADRAAALIVEKLAEIIPLKDALKATASGKAMIEYFTSALAQQDADNVQGYDREAEVKAFEEAWVSGTQDLGEDYQAAKKAWLLKAQQATPVDDKSHPRFLAGYDAGMKDAKRPKPGSPTPLGVLVLKYFELLDQALDLDKSPSAWVHKPKGSLQERMAAWQEVHAVRREIKEFIG